MPQPSGYCRKCGYPIHPGQCPECGLVNATPSRLSLTQRRNRRRLKFLAPLILVIGLAPPGWLYRKAIFQNWFPTAWLCAIESGRGSWAPWATEALDARTAVTLPHARNIYETRKEELTGHPKAIQIAKWQGDWSGGDLGVSPRLTLSPNIGWELEMNAFMQRGPIVGVGTVREINSATLRLTTDLQRGLVDRRTLMTLHMPKPLLSETMLIVDGPEVEFLVPDFAVRQFCIDASARKNLLERYLGRWSDRHRSSGCFDNPRDFIVPTQYEPYLLPYPIIAKVTSVRNITYGRMDRGAMSEPSVQAEITLNVGRADGVLPAMEFFAPCDSKAAQARVRSVAEHECTLDYADTHVYMVEPRGRKLAAPAVGWEMTTRCVEGDEPEHLFSFWWFGLEH